MLVFGNNYSYANARSSGDSYRFATTNQLALTRNNSAGMLDDALTNLAWEKSVLADKTSTSIYGKLVDIFA